MKALVKALIHWFWLLIMCLVAGFLIGKGLTVLIPPTYQSTAVVQLNAQTRSSQAQIIQPITAYSTLVTSDSVLNPVLKSYPTVDRLNFVTKQLVVTPDVPSQSIQIQVSLASAKGAADIANRIAQLLVSQQNAYINAQYTQEIQIVKNRIAAEQGAIDHLNQQYAATPATNTATLQQLSNQIDQQRTLQNADISTQQTLMTERALYGSPLSVVQTASVATKPSSLVGSIPFTPVTMAVMFLSGLIAISFLEQNAGRITGGYELQRRVSVPVLGAIRWTRPIPPYQLGDSKAPYAEDCRVMMADVLLHMEAANARVLAVTGTRVRAGSSSVASQLAVLLAQSKRRVLLIDANFYSPSQHELLDLPNSEGLARMLEEARKLKISSASVIDRYPDSVPQQSLQPGAIVSQRDIGAQFQTRAVALPGQAPLPVDARATNGSSAREVVEFSERFPFDRYSRATNIQNLYLLPAGETQLNPSILLSMPVMGLFLKWASRRGDYVIIDCPALIHAESHVLGSLSDQTLLVVDASRDRMKQVVKVKEELLNAGVKLSGLVVNKLGRWV